MKKIIIAEPSLIIAAGLKKIIQESPNFEVIAHRPDMDNLTELIDRSKVDVLIINPLMIESSKRLMVKSLFAEFPLLSIVAICYQYIDSAILKQYQCCIEICDHAQTIDNKLRRVAPNDLVDSTNTGNGDLSQREKDVLILIAKGLMNKEIADKLNLSIHTVITHRKNITKKTGIKSVSGLTVYTLLHNLIDQDEVI